MDNKKRLRSRWNGLKDRCKNPERYEGDYYSCTLHSSWEKFENFYQWAILQIGHDRSDFEIDKDILSDDIKSYSPESCAFVPREVNNFYHENNKNRKQGLPLGVQKHGNKYRAQWREDGIKCFSPVYLSPKTAFKIYKENKERVTKLLANKWKEQISERVYNRLMNYVVEDVA